MQPRQLLESFTAAGLAVSLTLDNGLKVTPAKALNDDLRGTIKAHKAALVEYLRLVTAKMSYEMPTGAPTPSQHNLTMVDGTDLHALLHSPAMSPREVDTFTARLVRLTDRGVTLRDAERLADVLVQRDREDDDRRVCFECYYLQGTGRWRCRSWQAAGVARDGIGCDLVLMLQRCDGFSARQGLI